MEPAQTDYEKRCLYGAYDVTSLVKKGENAIGVVLGDVFFNQNIIPANHDWLGKAGSYGRPCLHCSLKIEQKDNSELVVISDETWKCSEGPILSSNVYAGEFYNALLEIPNWNTTECNDENWIPARPILGPKGAMEEQIIPPIKIIDKITPINTTKYDEGSYVVDMGQNFAGWVQIAVKAPPGTRITMTFAETIFPNGRLNTASTGLFARLT